MDLVEAQEAILALFAGEKGEKAERGALLLGAVLLSHRPPLPVLVVDEVSDG